MNCTEIAQLIFGGMGLFWPFFVDRFAFSSVMIYNVSQKKQDIILLSVTLSNVNLFSKFFHC